MREKIVELLPEINWITDQKLREQVIDTYEDALKTGGWEPEDMKKIPFTLLSPTALHPCSPTRAGSSASAR